MIEIKRAKIEDSILLHSWWNNPELMKSVGYDEGLGIDIESVVESIKSKNIYLIWLNNTPIGELNHKDVSSGVMQFGIKIIPDFQSKGYGYMILIQFFKYLRILGANKFVLDVLKDNEKAIRLYKRLGFIQIEERVSGWVDPFGVARDYLIMEKENGT